MQTIVHNMPGYRINEYLLVLSPHEELRNRIQQVKKEFYDKYQSMHALWGKPHITLASFSQYQLMEERLVNRLRTLAMGYHPIKVELKDFGAYPSHTIFINVTTKEPIRAFVRSLRENQRLLRPDGEHKPLFPDDPHVSVARKLQPWQFEKGWLDYSHRHFTGRFIADSVLLLKRGQGDKAWQVAERFEFQNLPVNTRQGELFA